MNFSAGVYVCFFPGKRFHGDATTRYSALTISTGLLGGGGRGLAPPPSRLKEPYDARLISDEHIVLRNNSDPRVCLRDHPVDVQTPARDRASVHLDGDLP